jgi:hypothetical protein
MAREENERQAEEVQAPEIAAQAALTVEPDAHLEVLRPPRTISVARMNKFTLKLQAQEA